MKKIKNQIEKIRKIHNKKLETEQRIENRLTEVALTEEEKKKLIVATNNFFPNSGQWSSNAYNKSEDSIYCHLRDNYWLAKRISKIIPEIEYAKILKFVSTSENFKNERHNYEQKIVEWQINFMMKRKEGWIADDLIDMMPDCDIKFRQAIINTLVAIGIDKEAIEEGIEKNADLWRNHYMNQAFNNQYNNFTLNANFLGSNYGVEIPPALEIHKEKWIKLRKYEYYQRHTESVTKYGNIGDLVDLNMTLKDVIELKSELESLHSERMEEIENYKKQRDEVKRKNKTV